MSENELKPITPASAFAAWAHDHESWQVIAEMKAMVGELENQLLRLALEGKANRSAAIAIASILVKAREAMHQEAL